MRSLHLGKAAHRADRPLGESVKGYMRKRIPKEIETAVLTKSGRRCCLCFGLRKDDTPRKGQIAHINRNAEDYRLENLAFLCLDHHDDYDSTTSQSKGYTAQELKHHRNQLYLARGMAVETPQPAVDPELAEVQRATQGPFFHGAWTEAFEFVRTGWMFPLWQVADQPEFFAYKSHNGADGVCLIERIDLPDGRTVVACISLPGNPGCSISNAVEELCFQICSRFEIPPHRVVWLLNYDELDSTEWDRVQFSGSGDSGPFVNPQFSILQADDWTALGFHPKQSLRRSDGHWESKLAKLFPWPPPERAL
jgi:hypothetical protein